MSISPTSLPLLILNLIQPLIHSIISFRVLTPRYPTIGYASILLDSVVQIHGFLDQIPIRNLIPNRVDPPIASPLEAPVGHTPVRVFGIGVYGDLHERSAIRFVGFVLR